MGAMNTPRIEGIDLTDSQFLIRVARGYIKEYCTEFEIESIRKESENTFCGALKYFCDHFLKLSLYTDKKRYPNIATILDYRDIGQLQAIRESYFFLCDGYNKIPSFYSFYCFSGIPESTLKLWYQEYINNPIYSPSLNNTDINSPIDEDDNIYNSDSPIYISPNNIDINNNSSRLELYNAKVSYNRYLIYKDIYNRRETALSGRLETGQGAVVGTIAVLNHQYGWADNTRLSIEDNKRALTLSELPQIEGKNDTSIT